MAKPYVHLLASTSLLIHLLAGHAFAQQTHTGGVSTVPKEHSNFSAFSKILLGSLNHLIAYAQSVPRALAVLLQYLDVCIN